MRRSASHTRTLVEDRMTGRGRIALLTALLIAGLTAPALAQKPVKIGVLTPLSPPGDAAAGQFIARGAKMGAEDVNARGGVLGGRKIDLVVEDDAGTPEKGAAGFRKLTSQDQAVAVVGQFHSSVMTAVQVLAEQFKVPVFSTQASARQVTEKHLNYTFRTHVIDPDRCQMWTRWVKERGFKRAALITENTDYGVGLVDETKKAFDVGLHPAVPMLISYDAPARPEYWKNLGEKGTWASFIVYYHPTMKLTPRGEAFRARCLEQFKEQPVYGGLNAYAQVMLLADAINAAKSDKPDDIVKALLSTKFVGWNGTIAFTRGEGPYWQQWTPPMLFLQYTKPDMPFTEAKIVYPPELKTGDLMMAPK